MSEERYRCVCHTCDVERLIDGLEKAQEFFNDHADRSHEVELFNRTTLQQYSDTRPETDPVTDADGDPHGDA